MFEAGRGRSEPVAEHKGGRLRRLSALSLFVQSDRAAEFSPSSDRPKIVLTMRISTKRNGDARGVTYDRARGFTLAFVCGGMILGTVVLEGWSALLVAVPAVAGIVVLTGWLERKTEIRDSLNGRK